MTTIKWTRLKRIANEMCNKPVEIYATTKMDEPIISMVGIKEDGAVDILLNMNRVKDEEMAIKAIAHELTHAMRLSDQHGAPFSACLETVEAEMVRRYAQ